MIPATREALLLELRQQGIADEKVLAAIADVPRDFFVPDALKPRAWENIPLPIANGQTISQPYIVALMTQELKVDKTCKVLEVGTGSGYQGAVLAKLARRVFTIERYRSLHLEAQDKFRALHLHNITAKFGDGMKGWPEQAPFDRIMVTAAAEDHVPEALVEQLSPSGFMLLPVRAGVDTQEIIKVWRTADGFDTEHIIPARFVPLVPGIAKGR